MLTIIKASMRLLKQLTIQGFKSFANKTVIEFQHGFNCVIGPNGAGKSNVLDALCFVLGKSSSKGLTGVKKGSQLLKLLLHCILTIQQGFSLLTVMKSRFQER